MISERIIIDKDLLLQATNGGLDVFDKLFGGLEIDEDGRVKNVCNPCYDDTKPSVAVWKWEERGIWWYKDHGNPDYSGDCFALVRQFKGEEWYEEHRFPGVLRYMAELCEINPESVKQKSWRDQRYEEKMAKRAADQAKENEHKVDFDKFKAQYGWTDELLSCYNVTIEPTSQIDRKFRGHSTFRIRYNGDGFAKVYRPHPKHFRFEGSKPADYCFGLSQIEDAIQEKSVNDEFLLIVAGEKDTLSAVAAGYYAVSLNSETATHLPERFRMVAPKFKKCVVLYDNDDTGLKSTIKLCSKYPELTPAKLPECLAEQGGKDFSDYIQLDLNREELKYAIENADRSHFHLQADIEVTSDEGTEEIIKTTATPRQEQEKLSIRDRYNLRQEQIKATCPAMSEQAAKVAVPDNVEVEWTDDNQSQEEIADTYFDDQIFDNLPGFFKKLMQHFPDRRDRDIAFLSILTTLSSVLRMFFGIYNSRRMGTNIFTFIVAPAGSGKGAASYGRMLVSAVDRQTRQAYEKEMALYRDNTKEGIEMPEPKPRGLLIPGNSSSAALLECLDGNEDYGCMHETEADTIAATMDKEWGNYSDAFRKIAMHEPVSSGRIKKNIVVERPSMSALLTGTPSQVVNLIQSPENGLFSRIGWYRHFDRAGWKDQFQGNGIDLEAKFQEYGAEVLKWWDWQKELDTKIEIKFTSEQRRRTFEYFENKLRDLQDKFDIDIDASVRRFGLLQFRVAMILTAVRYLNQGTAYANVLYVDDTDFTTSLLMMDCLFAHMVSVFKDLKKLHKDRVMDVRSILSIDQLRLFIQLPDEFEKRDADQLSQSIGLSGNCQKMLEKFVKHKLVSKVSHGRYVKEARDTE